jgi:hypothetical protein
MEVIIDPDVKAVAEFMQSKMETRKLVGVAESLRVIASILLGHLRTSPCSGVELVVAPITYESLPTATE